MSFIKANEKSWIECLERMKDAALYDVYYEPRYVSLYAEKGEMPLAYLFTQDDDFLFFPFIKKPIEGTPYCDFETAYGYGGPISSTQDHAFLERAWHGFEKACQAENIIAGTIRYHPYLKTDKNRKDDFISAQKIAQTVSVPLSGTLEEIVENFKPDHQRRVAKVSAEHSVDVFETDKSEDWALFEEIYAARMTDLDARDFYHFSSNYFQNIQALPKSMRRLYLVKIDGKLAAGAIILTSESFWHYHLSASVSELMQYSPNNLLLNFIIQKAKQNGAAHFHLGGGRSTSPDDGLLRFKENFSSHHCDLYIGGAVLEPDIYNDLCRKWSEKNPEKTGIYQDYILKYRY